MRVGTGIGLSAIWAIGLFGLMPAAQLEAQPSLRESLKDIEIASHWIYDDLPRAFAEAKTTGKPLLIVLRCVPCPPGRTLDAQVMRPDAELEELEKQFVCVRVIQTKGLDLKLFQYDYDMSWAAMFMNADQTIYGRYGTRTTHGPGSDAHLSREGFAKALQRALELHKNYPANREQLVGKTFAGTPDYARPEHIPGLTERAVGPTTRQNCIHCHMVKEYALRAKWEAGRLTREDLWVYPMPEQIGITVDDRDGQLITAVEPGSPAAEAGLSPGQRIVAMNGQPILSVADMQWVLHNLPAESTLTVGRRAPGGTRELTLEKATLKLTGKWKESDIAWRASSWYGLRQGVKIEPMPVEDRRKAGLADDSMAMVVKGLFGKGGPKLKAAGLQMGDVIVAVDGKSPNWSESDFLLNLRLEHGPGDSIRFSVLRGGQRHEYTIPLW